MSPVVRDYQSIIHVFGRRKVAQHLRFAAHAQA